MFFWSPRATSAPGMASRLFSTASDSPVRELSFTFSDQLLRMRPSATIRSPASSSTMSPGTTWSPGTSTRWPLRSTLAEGALMAFRLSRDFSALKYCTVPSTALRISTAKMTSVLSRLPENMEMMAATMRMATSRSLNCSAKTASQLFFSPSASRLGPYCSSRWAACWSFRPPAVTPSCLRASWGDRLK